MYRLKTEKNLRQQKQMYEQTLIEKKGRAQKVQMDVC